MSTVSYYWSKDTKADAVLLNLNQDYSLLGRNFITVRNIMGKDIKKEKSHVLLFFLNCFPAKYQSMAITLYISCKMRSVSLSLLPIKTLGYRITPEPNTFTYFRDKNDILV